MTTPLRAALATILPALPLRGVARVHPCAPFYGRTVARVALRFDAGAPGEQRDAVALVVEELRAALPAGGEADGVEGEWRFVRVVGAC